MTVRKVDYLIVGAGAMGMAFADTLFSETDATIAIVDRYGRPGGHWTLAYPYVRLHQPSSFYGVNSTALGSGEKDAIGGNRGLYELASAPEICAYLERILQRRLLPSGRVHYFPLCEHEGEGVIRSKVTGDLLDIEAATLVDATYMNVTVPAMRPPPFEVSDGIACLPLNALGHLERAHEGYVVIGGGKSAMDAILWLLAHQVSHEAITWIMPRDSWLLDRANIQFQGEFYERNVLDRTGQLEAIASSETIDDMFAALEASGQLMRLDPSVRPTMYRCATVTRAELESLRTVTNVVRLGRVKHIGAGEIVLDDGAIPTSTDILHVDCTADGLPQRPAVPIFAGNRLTLQSVRTCQQVFSAAFIAHVEATEGVDAQKNAVCGVVPHPDSDVDWLRVTLASMRNQFQWQEDAALRAWLSNARLDGFARPAGEADESTPSLEEARERTRAAAPAAIRKLEALLAQA